MTKKVPINNRVANNAAAFVDGWGARTALLTAALWLSLQ